MMIYYLCDHQKKECGENRMCWTRYRLCTHTLDKSHAATPEEDRVFVKTCYDDFWEVTHEIKLLPSYIVQALELFREDEIEYWCINNLPDED